LWDEKVRRDRAGFIVVRADECYFVARVLSIGKCNGQDVIAQDELKDGWAESENKGRWAKQKLNTKKAMSLCFSDVCAVDEASLWASFHAEGLPSDIERRGLDEA
jgi:hypothetical protein